jgi:hypothetical protein
MVIPARRWLAEWPEAKRRRIAGCPDERDIRRCGISCSRGPNFIFLAACHQFQRRENSEFAVCCELDLSSPAVALPDREVRAVLDDSPYQVEVYPDYFAPTLFRCGPVSCIIREIL